MKKLSILLLSFVIFQTALIASDDISNSRKNAITNAIKKASPAIVGINVTETKQVVYQDPMFDFIDPRMRQFFPEFNRQRTQNYEIKGLGTGFIISSDGYILTNHHVAGNANKVVVTTTEGKEYDAKIIGSDAISDVALLKIEAKDLPYLKLGNSDNVLIGEWAIAFGNPFGLFDVNAKPTVTVGVISNSGVNFIHQETGVIRVYRNMLQTDAAISSGNSGGPLLNADGEVIGMNTVIFSTANSNAGSGSIGIGYSIPINRVKQTYEKIKEHKEIKRDFDTGIDIREIDDQVAKYLGIKKTRGVVIFAISRNAAGDEAGLEPGDIILEVDGEKILRSEDLMVIIKDGETGQKLNFKISRDGEILNKTVELKNTIKGDRSGRRK
ncbi:MAG: trypsin-like peptidase domain-containing protein [Candidatus Kapabacteria bacterium]|nr:trypsin-like peptidase domain-containing protein [Candidatus Kapabacteria bacterium]